MSEKIPDFHEKAVHSSLFKGRYDWYFCYLKSEKIAHAICLIASQSPTHDLDQLAQSATQIPQTIAYCAAGEATPGMLLADLFCAISLLRIQATQGHIHDDNAKVLVGEYEQIIRKIAASTQPSPFLSVDDFLVPEIHSSEPEELVTRMQNLGLSQPTRQIKDSKGHIIVKDIRDKNGQSKGQNSRMEKILQLVREKKSVSVRDIVSEVRDCSEKTIQRELTHLIAQGFVRKVGERRWSTYTPA
ncbi:DeoR family transcriptional regulator [Patescibacteria group bacterium]|nr:DeoR family transcriptional regulator [Patescibacteria group bacterium]